MQLDESILSQELTRIIQQSLENDKAQEITTVSLKGKTDLADTMVIATVQSSIQAGAATTHLVDTLEKAGFNDIILEGFPDCDWILIDTNGVIVHIFLPETREYYSLEKLWGPTFPDDITVIH